MYDIIIIGAGPAGMTAALYVTRANKKVLILEASNYGGQIINASHITNYPVEKDISGYDFASKLYNQIINHGVEIRLEKVLNKSNIEIIYNSNITKLNGISNLESIVLNNNKTIDINALFVAIGQEPNTEYLNNIIVIDANGYIKSNELCHTNIDGIFVAGDIRDKSLRQLVTATSDGAIAATEAIKYINE